MSMIKFGAIYRKQSNECRSMWKDSLMYKDSIEILKSKNIQLDEGLSYEHIDKIKEVYGIIFPESLKNFLMTTLPVSEGFYDWRDFSDENIRTIKEMIAYPKQYIQSIVNEIDWNENWGIEPDDEAERNEIILSKLNEAPKLIPVFAHRYIPDIEAADPPIISIHGSDIIYYGKDFNHYIEEEFGNRGERITDIEEVGYIPFWSDIM